ncbi:MAG: hypothetical protein LC798_15370 [Chloroflexi bacterium]|nr:hypothetical protein [Chloroflexota bacterium]
MKRKFDPKVHCGGKTEAGTPCRRFKGQGTPHPGAGKCSKHAGSTKNGCKAATREAALAFAVGALGAERALSPVDAIEESVRLAGGVVDYYRFALAKAAVAKGGPDTSRIEELTRPYMDALKLQKDVAKAALDAGVADRQQQLAERQAAVFSEAITDGLRDVPVFAAVATPEALAAYATVVKVRLLVLQAQDDPLVVEGSARELPAAA